MDEIRFVAGPIVARYMDKIEEERQATLKIEEEKAAQRKAELEAQRKANEEANKAEGGDEKPDVEMPDAPKDETNGPEVDGVD